MIRVKRGVTKRASHKKWLKKASGYFGRSSTCYRIARSKVEKGMRYATAHRRKNASRMRSLWIMRINAAARSLGSTYSKIISALARYGCLWNRKTLSECAIHHPETFKTLIDKALST